jgi:hypothetical protein
MGLRVRISVGIAFLLALVVAASAAVALDLPPESCGVEIEVDKPVIEVSITSTSPGAGSTWGNVTFQPPPDGESVFITLTAVVDKGWPVSVSPGAFHVGNPRGHPLSFTVTIIVPPGEPVSEAVTTLVARMQVGDLQCESAPLDEPRVVVRPYIQVLNFLPSQSLYFAEGPELEATVLIQVEARTNADLVLEFNYTAPEGVRVEGPERLNIPWSAGAPSNATVSLRVLAPGAETGVYHISVAVTARAADSEPWNQETGFSLSVTDDLLTTFLWPATAFAIAAATGAAVWLGYRRYRPRA